MLERIPNLPPGIDGISAVGRLSKQDYERVYEPLVDGAHRDGRRLRLLYQIGPEFDGFTAGAAWEDAKMGLRTLGVLEGFAIVSDIGWLRESSEFMRFFTPCPVRVFRLKERDEAIAWLQSLPQRARVSHRLLPESGVIVLDVTEPLRAADFDALAATADSWTEAQGALRGFVIHARIFPGWENYKGLLRHIRFVRDHQRKIRRVALAGDSKLTSFLPDLADHFVEAELKSFGFDELDKAKTWAAAPSETDPDRPSGGI